MKRILYTIVLISSFLIIKFHDSIPHHHDLECYVNDLINSHHQHDHNDSEDHKHPENNDHDIPEHHHTVSIHLYEFVRSVTVGNSPFMILNIVCFNRQSEIPEIFYRKIIHSDASIPLGHQIDFIKQNPFRGPPLCS